MKKILMTIGLITICVITNAQLMEMGGQAIINSKNVIGAFDSLQVGDNGVIIDSITDAGGGKVYFWSNGVSIDTAGLGLNDYALQTDYASLNTLVRGTDNVVTSTNSYANGDGNNITNQADRAGNSFNSVAFGENNILRDWSEFATGSGNYIDSKIGGVLGNNNLNSANDSYVVGNMNAAGRVMFAAASQGIEDAGDGLGNRYYVVIAATESKGDVQALFPNKLVPVDSIVPRYGAGAQKDSLGNIYPNGMTPYTNLTWAAHRYCYIKTATEGYDTLMKVMKTIYTPGVGTKVYLETATKWQNKDITYIFSSTAPTVNFRGWGTAANGLFVAGRESNAWAGSIAIGYQGRAWGSRSKSLGNYTRALAANSTAMGYESKATIANAITNSSGKISKVGDNQTHEYTVFKTGTGVGWHELIVFNITDTISIYAFEIIATVMDVGLRESASYRIEGTFNTFGAVHYNVIGTPIRTLLGENFTTGDGVTTGPRLSWYGLYPTTTRVSLRMDGGVAGQSYRISASVKLFQTQYQ